MVRFISLHLLFYFLFRSLYIHSIDSLPVCSILQSDGFTNRPFCFLKRLFNVELKFMCSAKSISVFLFFFNKQMLILFHNLDADILLIVMLKLDAEIEEHCE